MDERWQKGGEQQRTLTNVVKISPQMSSLGEKILQLPAGTRFLHPSLHWQNFLDGEHTWH